MKNMANKFRCPKCGAPDSGYGVGHAQEVREYPGTRYMDGFQEERFYVTYNCGSQYCVSTFLDIGTGCPKREFHMFRDCQS